MKACVIIWKDKEGKEHAYFLDKRTHIIPEAFEFWLKNRKDTKEVRLIEIEPIKEIHAPVIIRSLEPLPKEVKEVMSMMATEHGTIGAV